MRSIYFLALAGLLTLSLACTDDSKVKKAVTPAEIALENSEKVEKLVKGGSTAMSTDTDVPVPEWVADVLKSNPDDAKVIVCTESGKPLYFINPCTSCPIQLTEIYNSNQEKVCYIGGPQQEITCPEFKFNGSRDCKPVNLTTLTGGHSDNDGDNH